VTTAWADILLPAKSAFPTSLWVMQEVGQRMERLSRRIKSTAYIPLIPTFALKGEGVKWLNIYSA
jgi:hypothetical protein